MKKEYLNPKALGAAPKPTNIRVKAHNTTTQP